AFWHRERLLLPRLRIGAGDRFPVPEALRRQRGRRLAERGEGSEGAGGEGGAEGPQSALAACSPRAFPHALKCGLVLPPAGNLTGQIPGVKPRRRERRRSSPCAPRSAAGGRPRGRL